MACSSFWLFDHRGDCRDSVLHKTCAGRWRGVVLLGFDADGKRLRRKVSRKTKAVADWLEEGLPGRTAKTVEANRDSLRRCWR